MEGTRWRARSPPSLAPLYARQGEPELRRISLNGSLYAVPFEKLFREHTEKEIAEMRESIRAVWVLDPIKTYLSPAHGRAIFDGMRRALVALEVDPDREVPIQDHGEITDAEAESLAWALNKRRHLTAEELETLRKRELERIAELRRSGLSIRAIAEKTQIPSSTVYNHLSGVHGGTADGDGDDEELDHEASPGKHHVLERVTGRDGKSYLATKAPVVVAQIPPGMERDAALEVLDKARKHANLCAAAVAELLAGPFKARFKKAGIGTAADALKDKLEGIEI